MGPLGTKTKMNSVRLERLQLYCTLSALRIETESAKVANFEFPPPQLIQAKFSAGKTE